MLKSNTVKNATCPFCGLICDDLTLTITGNTVATEKHLPDYCRSHYAATNLDAIPSCLISGKPAELNAALARCIELLKKAERPLFGGMAADINGIRSALNLARHYNGVVDHKTSEIGLRTARVAQDEGWTNCTLSEARNRAEMIVVLGKTPFTLFPRLIERLAPAELGNFQEHPPEWILVGDWEAKDSVLPQLFNGRKYRILPAAGISLDECPRVLNTLLNVETRAAGSTNQLQIDEQWKNWFSELLNCKYSIFTWSARDFSSHIPLHALSRFLKQMNQTTRCMGLPLAGTRADLSFQQVCTWQTGAPGRIAFTNHHAKHNVVDYDGTEMLKQKSTDLLIWISPLDPESMPKTEIPSILIGHPSAENKTLAEVFIPAGIPGIDHGGNIVRTDMVASLHLKKLRDSGLQPASKILNTLLQQSL